MKIVDIDFSYEQHVVPTPTGELRYYSPCTRVFRLYGSQDKTIAHAVYAFLEFEPTKELKIGERVPEIRLTIEGTNYSDVVVPALYWNLNETGKIKTVVLLSAVIFDSNPKSKVNFNFECGGQSAGTRAVDVYIE